MSDDRIAKPGTIWVCGACGKTARDRYGIEGEHDRGWDESCMMNAFLATEGSIKKENGRVVSAAAVVGAPRENPRSGRDALEALLAISPITPADDSTEGKGARHP